MFVWERGFAPPLHVLLRQSFEQGRARNSRPENVAIRGTYANDFALASALQTGDACGHAHMAGEEDGNCALSGLHRGLRRSDCWQARCGLRGMRTRCQLAGSGASAAIRIYAVRSRVGKMVMEINQKWKTLPGRPAFQPELSASRPLIPAGRRDAQTSSGKRRRSQRHINILDPRQLCFRDSLSPKFGDHGLPHLLTRRQSRRPSRFFARALGRKQRSRQAYGGNEEASENQAGNHGRLSTLSGRLSEITF
jgi:hypothetical protein